MIKMENNYKYGIYLSKFYVICKWNVMDLFFLMEFFINKKVFNKWWLIKDKIREKKRKKKEREREGKIEKYFFKVNFIIVLLKYGDLFRF